MKLLHQLNQLDTWHSRTIQEDNNNNDPSSTSKDTDSAAHSPPGSQSLHTAAPCSGTLILALSVLHLHLEESQH